MRNLCYFLIFFLYSFSGFSQNDTIIVTGDFDYPPFSFIDKDGKPSGYDIEVMTKIADITGLNIKFELTNWDNALELLKNGKAGAITSIVYAAEREKIYDFSFPLHTEYYGIFANRTTEIEDINDLGGKSHAILKGDISNELFYRPMGLTSNDTAVQSYPEGFSLVNSNQCQYVIAPYALGMEIISDNHFNKIEVKGPPIIPSVFCYAVKQGDYELLAWINQGVEILSRNGELDRIYNKWVKYKRDDNKYKEFFYYSLIGLIIFLAVIVILFIFGYSLRKQVQKKTLEIKKNEAIYQNVFNAVDDGLVILDESEIILEANHKAYELFSYKNEQLIGEHIRSLVREENKEKVKEVYNLIKAGKPFYIDSFEREINGTQQYVTLKGFKTDIQEQQRYLIVIHDITKEEKNLIELQKAKKNVEIANNAKSTFLSTISHEIRTPLFAVIGYTRLLKKTSLTTEQSEYNKKIEISGKLLLNLVNDILDLTKMEAEKLKLLLKPFDIRQLIKDICELESIKAAEKSIALIYDIDEKVPKNLTGDKLLISRIILNIVNNAIKFTDKGMVTVMVNIENPDQTDENRPLNIIFSVKDTGIGMTEATQKKIFSPFEQAQDANIRKHGGTGLGLALSKQLVDLMQGTILVESSLGAGSIFNVTIPLERALTEPKENKHLSNKIEEHEQITVLLVEDNEFNAEILLSELKDAGFLVTHAQSGFDAIKMLKTNDFQVILMDIEMPELDGFATLQKIRELKLTEAPVIALSAHNLAAEKEKALSCGMVDYLNKPISIKHLSKAIYSYKMDKKNTESSSFTHINEEKGLALFENDKGKYINALLRFKQHFSNTSTELSELFEKDRSTLKTKTHNLKSAAKTIGAINLFEMAQNHDEILRNNLQNYTIEQLELLKIELNSTLTEVDLYLNRL